MNNNVMMQQFYLNCLGYNAGKVDGIHGKRTQAAIDKFFTDAINSGIKGKTIGKEAEQKLPRHLIVAAQYLGEKEIPGLKHNWKIVAMWEALKAKFRYDKTPWCSAFVAHVLKESYGMLAEQEIKRENINASAQSG